MTKSWITTANSHYHRQVDLQRLQRGAYSTGTSWSKFVRRDLLGRLTCNHLQAFLRDIPFGVFKTSLSASCESTKLQLPWHYRSISPGKYGFSGSPRRIWILRHLPSTYRHPQSFLHSQRITGFAINTTRSMPTASRSFITHHFHLQD